MGRKEKELNEDWEYEYPFELIQEWELDVPIETKPKQVFVADINGDGEIDLLCGYPTYFHIKDIYGGVFKQVNILNNYSIDGCFGLDNDEILEILVTVKIENTCFLYVYDHKGLLLKKIQTVTGKDVREPIGWDGFCHAFA